MFHLFKGRRLAWAALPSAVLLLMHASPARAAGPEMLFEPATGTVFYALEPDRRWHPASITKIMTAFVVFEDVKAGRVTWKDDVPLSTYARIQPASRIGLRAGIKINLEEATAGMILRSANDFAVALAERIAGDEGSFVQRMNATARRLGMSRTNYENPHGLPNEEQVTTARDMARLVTVILRDFPKDSEVFSRTSIHIHRGTFYNANDLLRTFEGADGMKTGFTCEAGYNVVATATRNNHRLAAIVFGAPNRWSRSRRAKTLLEAGFTYLQQADKRDTLLASANKTTRTLAGPALADTAIPLGKATQSNIQREMHLTGPRPAEIQLPTPALVVIPAQDDRPAGTLQRISLKDLPISPATMSEPLDAATAMRMRKCPGSGRTHRRHRPVLTKIETKATDQGSTRAKNRPTAHQNVEPPRRPTPGIRAATSSPSSAK
ncbi:MAG: D-alanyl-D-alanine carboxypeptidase family protein [Hyphomicrobiaceae bacterium]